MSSSVITSTVMSTDTSNTETHVVEEGHVTGHVTGRKRPASTAASASAPTSPLLTASPKRANVMRGSASACYDSVTQILDGMLSGPTLYTASLLFAHPRVMFSDEQVRWLPQICVSGPPPALHPSSPLTRERLLPDLSNLVDPDTGDFRDDREAVETLGQFLRALFWTTITARTQILRLVVELYQLVVSEGWRPLTLPQYARIYALGLDLVEPVVPKTSKTSDTASPSPSAPSSRFVLSVLNAIVALYYRHPVGVAFRVLGPTSAPVIGDHYTVIMTSAVEATRAQRRARAPGVPTVPGAPAVPALPMAVAASVAAAAAAPAGLPVIPSLPASTMITPQPESMLARECELTAAEHEAFITMIASVRVTMDSILERPRSARARQLLCSKLQSLITRSYPASFDFHAKITEALFMSPEDRIVVRPKVIHNLRTMADSLSAGSDAYPSVRRRSQSPPTKMLYGIPDYVVANVHLVEQLGAALRPNTTLTALTTLTSSAVSNTTSAASTASASTDDKLVGTKLTEMVELFLRHELYVHVMVRLLGLTVAQQLPGWIQAVRTGDNFDRQETPMHAEMAAFADQFDEKAWGTVYRLLVSSSAVQQAFVTWIEAVRVPRRTL